VSMLLYELAAVAALLTGVLYLFRARPALALRRWAIDAAAVGAALAASLSQTTGLRETASLGSDISNIPFFARESVTLFAGALVPVGTPGAREKAALLLASAVVLIAGLYRSRRPGGSEARRWLLTAVVSAAVIASAYVILLGVEANYLHPLAMGEDNRGNGFAAVGFVLLVYSLAALASSAVFGSQRFALVAIVVISAIAVGYTLKVRADAGVWERASSMQNKTLSALRAVLPDPPSGSTIYAFGYPGFLDQAIPVFATPWDLDGAVKLTWNDPSLDAYPVFAGTRWVCGTSDLYPVFGRFHGVRYSGGYGESYFVDVRRRVVRRIQDQAGCQAAARLFRGAPQKPGT
jgi:hypothetical protein